MNTVLLIVIVLELGWLNHKTQPTFGTRRLRSYLPDRLRRRKS